MTEVEINSWKEFDGHFDNQHYRKWIFRGQSDSNWNLESSIHRSFSSAEKLHQLNGTRKSFNRIEHEKVMIDRFKSNAHLYLSVLVQTRSDTST